MHHDFLDKYARLNSPWSRIAPIVRMLWTIAFVIGVTSLNGPQLLKLVLFSAVLALWTLLTRLPVRFLLNKTAFVALPVLAAAAAAALFHPSPVLWLSGISIKTGMSVYAMVILISTTPFFELTAELARLKMPSVFVSALTFFYRYIFLLIETVEQFERAYVLRSAVSKLPLRRAAASGMVSAIFVRSCLLSEQVYQAMLARGYNGQFAAKSAAPLGWRQISLLLALAAVLGWIRLYA